MLEKAFRIVGDRLGETPIDHAVAHGDFTRWNLRKRDDGLFVFDPEAFLRNSLPYPDLFHFLAADSALLRRPSPTSRLRWTSLRHMAERIPPTWVTLQGPLYAAYLVETTLWYTSFREWHRPGQSGPFWKFLWAELDQVNNRLVP